LLLVGDCKTKCQLKQKPENKLAFDQIAKSATVLFTPQHVENWDLIALADKFAQIGRRDEIRVAY